MKVFSIAVICWWCAIIAPGQSEKTGSLYDYKVTKSLEIEAKNDPLKDNIPSNLMKSLHQQRSYDLEGRILNNVQHLEDSQGANSFYFPQKIQNEIGIPSEQPQPEIVQLQVPTGANEKKIVLQLPPQQYTFHPQMNQYQIPPRKHYKIILVRSPPAPTPPPQPLLPEIEEKTLIYVLVKKPDELTATQLHEIQKSQQDSIKFNKPEVFFIKYKADDKQQQPNQQNSNNAPSTNNFVEPVNQQQQQVDEIANKQQTSIDDIIRRQIHQGNNNNAGYSYANARV